MKLSHFSRAIAQIRSIDHEMPAQKIALLLEIARGQYPTVSELAETTGMSAASVSRNCAHLSHAGDRYGNDGLGLIRLTESAYDRRQKFAELTSEGRSFIQKIADIGEYR